MDNRRTCSSGNVRARKVRARCCVRRTTLWQEASLASVRPSRRAPSTFTSLKCRCKLFERRLTQATSRLSKASNNVCGSPCSTMDSEVRHIYIHTYAHTHIKESHCPHGVYNDSTHTFPRRRKYDVDEALIKSMYASTDTLYVFNSCLYVCVLLLLFRFSCEQLPSRVSVRPSCGIRRQTASISAHMST